MDKGGGSGFRLESEMGHSKSDDSKVHVELKHRQD